jgi:Ca2+-binding EF-hand superfamily protein
MLLAIAAGSGVAADPDLPARGPMPFEGMDADHDGFVSQEEYRRAHSERLQQRSEEQNRYQYRNMDEAPRYADIDADHDGRVSREEFQAHQQQRRQERQQQREERQQERMERYQERRESPAGGMSPGGGVSPPGGSMGGGKR